MYEIRIKKSAKFHDPSSQPEPAEILLCQTEDGQSRLEVSFSGETCRLSLTQMAELFQRGKSAISRHIKNVFEGGERTKTLKGLRYPRGVA